VYKHSSLLRIGDLGGGFYGRGRRTQRLRGGGHKSCNKRYYTLSFRSERGKVHLGTESKQEALLLARELVLEGLLLPEVVTRGGSGASPVVARG